MRIDSSVAFIPLGSAFSLVGGAGVGLPTNPIDLLGAGVGVPPPNIIGVQSLLFGTDFGIGLYKQTIRIFLNSTPTILGVGAQLNIQLQMAPDAGTPTYQPGAWQIIGETGYMTTAQLVAAQVGKLQQPIRLEWPPNFPAGLNPRFARLMFQPLAATAFTAGTVNAAFPTVIPDDYSEKFAQKNFTVA